MGDWWGREGFCGDIAASERLFHTRNVKFKFSKSSKRHEQQSRKRRKRMNALPALQMCDKMILHGLCVRRRIERCAARSGHFGSRT
jgi:hypothetical protein